MNDSLHHRLQERVKELTGLHRTARLLQDMERPVDALMQEITDLLPEAWQYPSDTAVRIFHGPDTWQGPCFVRTGWLQTAGFQTRDGIDGGLEVAYLVEKPAAHEGPFLAEERELINSLAQLLGSYFDHLAADQELQRAHDSLERQVHERTAELEREVAERRTAERQLQDHQERLRRLTAELCLAEAHERRLIAEDLHDHIGQALAFIKMRVREFQGNAMFCGFEDNIRNTLRLLDQTIAYTRDLTFEISPPVLYELGIEAGLDWLGEQFQQKHGIEVEIDTAGRIPTLPQEHDIMLFKSVQELLVNCAKHAGAMCVEITARRSRDELRLTIIDDGRGFDPTVVLPGQGFGLFSIRERLRQMGGRLEIDAAPGRGARITLVIALEGS